MNTKILLSLSVIAAVAAIAIGGTVAYFSDTDTSTGNTFTAGTLDLKVGGQDDPRVAVVTISNIQPGWGGEYWWKLKNTGSLPGIVSIEITPIINYENGQNEPEALVDSTSGDLEGELGAKIWVDKVHLLWTWNKVTRLNAGSPNGPQWWNKSLNDLGGNTLYAPAGNDLGILEPGEEVDFYLKLSLPETVGNEIQSDSVSFDIVFHLDQVTP
jgi:predicted ribosomally synthesized peptide with SipW-like signal peptide